jgi:hypothetical protein
MVRLPLSYFLALFSAIHFSSATDNRLENKKFKLNPINLNDRLQALERGNSNSSSEENELNKTLEDTAKKEALERINKDIEYLTNLPSINEEGDIAKEEEEEIKKLNKDIEDLKSLLSTEDLKSLLSTEDLTNLLGEEDQNIPLGSTLTKIGKKKYNIGTTVDWKRYKIGREKVLRRGNTDTNYSSEKHREESSEDTQKEKPNTAIQKSLSSEIIRNQSGQDVDSYGEEPDSDSLRRRQNFLKPDSSSESPKEE